MSWPRETILWFFALLFVIFAWHVFRWYFGIPPLTEPVQHVIEKLLGVGS